MTTVHRLDADSSVDEFVGVFQDFGANPAADTFDRLFHPDGTLWDAGMSAPAPHAQAPAVAASFLRGASDLRVAVRRWFARGDWVYLLTDNAGTFRGAPVSYPAVYACRLRDGLIAEARCYYDQARLLGPIAGGLPTLPVYWPTWTPDLLNTPAAGAGQDVEPDSFVRRYDALWHRDPADIPAGLASCYNRDGMILNPGMIRPISKPEIPGLYEMLLAAAPDLDPELRGWAGDGDALCVEWVYRASGRPDGRNPLELGVVDVFEFAGGGVQFGHAYFDSLTVLGRSGPSVVRLIAAARQKAVG